MDFRRLSFPDAPLIKTSPPGPKSKEYLDYQSAHESSAVSYPKGMPMAIRRAKGATVAPLPPPPPSKARISEAWQSHTKALHIRIAQTCSERSEGISCVCNDRLF